MFVNIIVMEMHVHFKAHKEHKSTGAETTNVTTAQPLTHPRAPWSHKAGRSGSSTGTPGGCSCRSGRSSSGAAGGPVVMSCVIV